MKSGSIRVAILLGALLCTVRAAVAGSGLRPVAFETHDVESYVLRSDGMNRNFTINVALPADYAQNPSKKYAALIVTDGGYAFPIAQDAASTLAEQGDIEGLFVVSVGTSLADGPMSWWDRRVFEFSPPDWPMTDPFGQEVAQGCEKRGTPRARCTGGAPAFFEFLRDALLPEVIAKYRIDSTRIGLFGSSAGGFFASWALLQEKSPFSSYIIASPALAYGDALIFRMEEDYARKHRDLPAAIYIASGSLEGTDPYYEGIGQIVSGQARLGARLRSRKYPGLRVYSEILSGMSHGDSTGTALNRGMRVLYGTSREAP